MIGKLFFIWNVFMILFTLIYIALDKIKRKQKHNKIIRKLNKEIGSDLMTGMIWFTAFLIWSAVFILRLKEVYYALNPEYLKSIFQLVDLEYLESLREYFYDNEMLSELHQTVLYISNFPSMLTWMIGSVCLSIVGFYNAYQKDVIYEDGVISSKGNIKWQKIVRYQWGKYHEKKRFKQEVKKYHELFLILENHKFIAKIVRENTYRIKLLVQHEDKDYIDNFLKSKLPISYQETGDLIDERNK